MNDRAVELLEQYEVEVFHTGKGRGAILCDTDKGRLILQEYEGKTHRLQLQEALLQKLSDTGTLRAERLIPTKEGEWYVKDLDGTTYILKTRIEGEECNIRDRENCLEAMRLLARLHKESFLPADTPGMPEPFSTQNEYEKHNRELRKVRKYLRTRSQKSQFELSLLGAYDYFWEQAQQVAEDWASYQAEWSATENPAAEAPVVHICHGDYQYHNILKDKDGWFLANFEKWVPDSSVRDLTLLLRKLLEKSNWSLSLGFALLEAYEKEQPLSARERIDLYYRLAYPEKFWKIVNFYYNSGKAWIPGRNQEKLDRLISQEKEKQSFLKEVFQSVETAGKTAKEWRKHAENP